MIELSYLIPWDALVISILIATFIHICVNLNSKVSSFSKRLTAFLIPISGLLVCLSSYLVCQQLQNKIDKGSLQLASGKFKAEYRGRNSSAFYIGENRFVIFHLSVDKIYCSEDILRVADGDDVTVAYVGGCIVRIIEVNDDRPATK